MEETEKRSFKPIIIAISILIAVAAAVAAILIVMNKNVPEDENSASGSSSAVSSSAYDKSTQTESTAKTLSDDKNTPNAVSENADGKTDDGSALPEGTKSDFIKKAEALNRWKASSIISSVTVEKVKVNLDVYEKGSKTGEKRIRYMYVAVAETRPSRVTLLNSAMYTDKTVAGMAEIVKGFEAKKEENVLFACSNEMCSTDGNNPNKYIYYNDSNNLESTVIKDGVLAQQGKMGRSLIMHKNGVWEYPVSVSLSTSAELIKNDILNSVSYTYPVLWDGKKYDHSSCKISYDIWSDFEIMPEGDITGDRTLIGKISDNKYAFLISDGFSGGYLIDYMKNDLGAKYAYWGAKGYATGMYVKGYGIITKNNYEAHGDLFCVK